MIYLIIDTETNGLPQSYYLPVSDLANWPRLISVAWALCDEEGRELVRHHLLVRPEGFRWNRVAQRIHGITPERAEHQGRPLAEVLDRLATDLVRADAWVGHHAVLDRGVIGAEYLRVRGTLPGAPGEYLAQPERCTMAASAQLSPGGEPLPLDALHQLLTGHPMKAQHDAEADMLATARCFFEMNKRGLFA